MAIPPNSLFVRVRHLKNNEGSLHLNDLEAEANKSQYFKIPVYIPYGEVIDIPLNDAVLISYKRGSIFKFGELNLLEAFIFSNRCVIEVENTTSYTITRQDAEFVLVDTSLGDTTVTLPELDMQPLGKEIVFKKATDDANAMILQTQGTDRIDETSLSILKDDAHGAFTLRAEPGGWWIASEYPSGAGAGAVDVSRSVIQTSRSIRVPGQGTLYLSVGDVPTSQTPIIFDRDINLVSGTISVDAPDASRDYDVEILVNGTVIETVPLPSGSSFNTAPLSSTVTAGDAIELRLRRTSGIGTSTFRGPLFTLRSFDA